ncbi:hypothetical protein TIFTF001_030495 [Ficus carica]|uniref:Retrotransposon gag domain-containing protein n=1 Tax=Ficus carica TaxID=3494 RepID=A0AA88DTK0_FICCA|nr:hypothetical protein TIFTF001_030495 [Ficus carica]
MSYRGTSLSTISQSMSCNGCPIMVEGSIWECVKWGQMSATFVERKDARLWWDTVQIRRDVSQMTWEDFVDEFKEKYFNTETMKAQ